MRLIPLALAAAGMDDASDVALTKTRMRDRELLETAIRAMGGESVEGSDELRCVVDGITIAFDRSADPMTARFEDHADRERAREILLEIDDEYLRLVQEAAYARLLEQAQREGMRVVDERVDETNAIVVTLQVGA